MTEVKMFQIPRSEEHPSEEMIAFLHECTQDWDGDDCGINIAGVLGGPGDWVVRDEKGLYSILTDQEVKENFPQWNK